MKFTTSFFIDRDGKEAGFPIGNKNFVDERLALTDVKEIVAVN